jgi:hypothetical protein
LCKAQGRRIDYDAPERLMYLQIGAPNSPSTILAPNCATGTVRASPGSNLRRVLPAPVVLRTCLGLILSWRCERDSWLAFLPSHHYLNTRHYIERTLPRYHFARARVTSGCTSDKHITPEVPRWLLRRGCLAFHGSAPYPHTSMINLALCLSDSEKCGETG